MMMMMPKSMRISTSNPKLWIVVAIGVTGIIVLADAERRRRRRRRRDKALEREDFGALVKRFELLPFPQPPPPAARLPLSGLTFAVKDIFEVKGQVTGFGNPDWERTHDEAEKTAAAITILLKNGATCVGSTVLDELSFGITGENVHYGTPVNPQRTSHNPGGSSSGSAVAVAAQLVDFALGTDTIGCVRIPAAYCGVLGYRPSHGAVSMIGVLPNSQSLDTVGWLARDPSILHRVGHALLKLNSVEPRRTRHILFADDLFELSKIPKQRTTYILNKVVENLSGYQAPKFMNLGQYIASNVSSLKRFYEQSTNLESGMETLKALSAVTILLQRYEFKTNHEEWVNLVKPKLGPDASDHVQAAIKTDYENIKDLYKVRAEVRSAFRTLLKDDGLLVIPTVADSPLKRDPEKGSSSEFFDRAVILSSISSMSGCCQATVPLGKHDEDLSSVSFAACHGSDKFLLDTILEIHSSLQEQASLISHSLPLVNTNGHLDALELPKEKTVKSFGSVMASAISNHVKTSQVNQAVENGSGSNIPMVMKVSSAVRCDLCDADCNSIVDYEKHLLGKKHKERLEAMNAPSVTLSQRTSNRIGNTCTTGQVGASGGGTAIPVVHGENLGGKAQNLVEGGSSIYSSKICTLCNVVCNSEIVFADHLAGKKHAAQAAAMASNSILKDKDEKGPREMKNSQPACCQVCKINFNSPEVPSSHLLGKKHQKNLEKQKKPASDTTTTHTQMKPVNEREKKAQSNNASNSNLQWLNKKTPSQLNSTDVDLETKKRKIMDGGGQANAFRTCYICNVVCNSETVFNSHLAGQKHAAMVLLRS
ncbi:hypothetical protein Dimus_004983 [Dionaea muscipula]